MVRESAPTLLQPGAHNSLMGGSPHGGTIGELLVKTFLMNSLKMNEVFLPKELYQEACVAYHTLWEKYGKKGFEMKGHEDRQKIGGAPIKGYVVNSLHEECLEKSCPALHGWLTNKSPRSFNIASLNAEFEHNQLSKKIYESIIKNMNAG